MGPLCCVSLRFLHPCFLGQQGSHPPSSLQGALRRAAPGSKHGGAEAWDSHNPMPPPVQNRRRGDGRDGETRSPIVFRKQWVVGTGHAPRRRRRRPVHQCGFIGGLTETRFAAMADTTVELAGPTMNLGDALWAVVFVAFKINSPQY